MLFVDLVVTDPPARTNGFVFVRIQGGFHEIRNSVRTRRFLTLLSSVTLLITFNFGHFFRSLTL